MTVLLPTSLDEALQMLSEHPSADLLTGGTDLMVEVNFNHRKPTTVIALRQLAELHTWSIDQQTQRITIGAGVPYAEMEHGPLADALPCLAEAARTVGTPQIRAAGTLGGNLGTCSPAGDGLPVLSALDATIHLSSQSGSREISFHDFMTGPKRNARQPGEIITSVSMNIPTGWQGYAKVGVRNAMVISVASACLVIDSGSNSKDNDQPSVRIALGSVGPTIIRCRETENWWNNLPNAEKRSASVIQEFGVHAGQESRPIDDHRSTAEYRRHAISVLSSRLLHRGTQS
jgi:CO/xanthine dehydrogenase FAD-binding subunit